VTDGLVSIRSAALPNQAAVFSGANKPSGLITLVRVRGARWGPDWRSAGDVLVRCDFPDELRASGNASRVLRLLLHHLATRTSHRVAVLRVPSCDDGLAEIAERAGFAPVASGAGGTDGGGRLLARDVPPVTYSDGVLTIRPQRVDDIDRHMEAIDDAQIDWLWNPGGRDEWEAMAPAEQREHNVTHLRTCQDTFGAGPTWTFSADLADASYVVYVDCDLANPHVSPGEANISYTAHPAYRGRGYTARAVRLLTRFLVDHTGAASAHIIVDARNEPSLRVARAVGATAAERWTDEYGRTMVRHVLPLRCGAPQHIARLS
jgi:RimJ/RimL family protein N-acetyltransferase